MTSEQLPVTSHQSPVTATSYQYFISAAIKVMISGHSIEVEFLEDILNEVKSLNVHERDLIHPIARICELVQVNPATSSAGEYSFSTARRVRTWLRSEMHQAHCPSYTLTRQEWMEFAKYRLPIRLYRSMAIKIEIWDIHGGRFPLPMCCDASDTIRVPSLH